MTLIGNLGAAVDADVDSRGRLHVGSGWSLDWVAGVADRWLEPSSSSATALTQHRSGGLPVVETSLRVPGGQLVHRAWCVAVAGGDLAVVEVENRSRDAVALALVAGGPVGFDGDRSAVVGGLPTIRFGRAPARVAAGTPEEVRAVLTSGVAPPPAGELAPAPAMAFVFPLAHTARLRLVAALSGASLGAVPAPDALPSAEQVAGGWQGHLDAAARVVLPDPALADAIAAARTTLLIAHDRRRPLARTADVGLALALWGHGDAAATALTAVVEHRRLDGGFGERRDGAVTASVLVALAAQSLTARGLDAGAAAGLAEQVAKAAHRLARRHRRGGRPPWFATAQLAAAVVLDRLEQPEAAGLCRERIARTHPAAVLDDVVLRVPAVADVAGPDVVAAARFLVDTRRFLVDDTEPSVLRLLARFPDAWLGQGVEVHRLPTRAGLLSFAVRWHGARPALLWEIDGPGPVHLTSGLDPAWSHGATEGEALLSPVEPAGGLPKVVAPLAAGGTAAGEAPGEGASFG